MRAAPLSRFTVTGVTSAVSVPRVLGFPVASPTAASVGARARLGEDVGVRELCDLISPVQFWPPLKFSTSISGRKSKDFSECEATDRARFWDKISTGVVGSTDHKIISIDNRRSTIDRNSP